MLNRQRIIYLLVFLVALLLFLNIILKSVTKSEPSESKNSELSMSFIEDKFKQALDNFGIQNEWISKSKIKKRDSISYRYLVRLPIKVTIPEVIKDINKELFKYEADIISTEKRINDNTRLEISSNKNLKLIADFKYEGDLSRPYSEISFLLKDIENASEFELEQINYLPFSIGAVLPLEDDSEEFAEKLKSKNINYYIEISSESDKVEFELDKDLGLDKLTSNVRNIISSFNSPRIFFIDKSKGEFDQEITDFLEDQFAKKGRVLMDIDPIAELRGENLDDLRSLLKFHLDNIDYGEHKIFLLNYKDVIQLHEELKNYTKLGNKIVNPAVHLSKQ